MSIIAIPPYRGYAERAQRFEALEGMNRLFLQQEMFRLKNRTYTDDLDALGFAGGCTKDCVYIVSFDIAPSTLKYTARFVPNPAGGSNGVNQTSDDDCSWFTIDALGLRAAENQNCLEGR